MQQQTRRGEWTLEGELNGCRFAAAPVGETGSTVISKKARLHSCRRIRVVPQKSRLLSLAMDRGLILLWEAREISVLLKQRGNLCCSYC